MIYLKLYPSVAPNRPKCKLGSFFRPGQSPGPKKRHHHCIARAVALMMVLVRWLQCDDCNQWFHLECFGVSAKLMASTKHFYCEVCAMERELEDARKSIGSRRASKSSLLLEVKLFECPCVTIPPIPFTGLPLYLVCIDLPRT